MGPTVDLLAITGNYFTVGQYAGGFSCYYTDGGFEAVPGQAARKAQFNGNVCSDPYRAMIHLTATSGSDGGMTINNNFYGSSSGSAPSAIQMAGNQLLTSPAQPAAQAIMDTAGIPASVTPGPGGGAP
jgi:hypothetical protein